MNKLIFGLIAVFFLISSCSKDGASLASDSGSNTGTGGSLSKFTISGDFLYTVQTNLLKVYEISTPSNPQLLNTVDLKNNAVETIFSNGTYLFFGTQTGMIIYSLSQPESPKFVSLYNHIASCDPVVVSGNYAWVTLSTGSACARGTNQLELIDISNIYSPELKKVYPFKRPRGLAVSGNYLYLCDEKDGLYVLNISNPMSATKKLAINTLKPFDVIAKGTVLTITALDGVYQYDCSDPEDLKLLSKIGVN